MENDLLYYLKEADIARTIVSGNVGSDVPDLDFQLALAKQLGYSEEDSTLVINHRLDADAMVKLLNGYDFNLPLESMSVTFTSSILPGDLAGRVDEKKIKVHGEVWKVHKYDKDQCPSNPHAHNVETGYKLHLGSGDLYDKKCHSLDRRISRRDLMSIRENLNGWTLPPLTV